MNQSRYTDLIIIRVAPEIVLKAERTRHRFRNRLKENLATALKLDGIDCKLEERDGRLLLRTKQVEAALSVLPRVFGIGSYSPVEAIVTGDLEDFTRAAVEKYRERVTGKRFAVRIRRTGPKRYTTPEMERTIGAALAPYCERVDLTNPEITVRAQVHGEKAYFYSEHLDGARGFPVGMQGRMVVLISGGFDSAVAAWSLMRRGATADFVFCNLGGEAYERSVLQVTHTLMRLWGAGQKPRFFSVDFAPLIDAIKDNVEPQYWQIVLKRLMYRAGCKVAHWRKADAIVTGEALGQVSSQTLSNLNSIESASDLPVLRPLISYEKTDIVELARRIGTASLSEKVREYCAITPRNPATRSSWKVIEREEGKIDLSLVAAQVETARTMDLMDLTEADLAQPYVFKDAIPEGATVIDLQPRDMFELWHVEGAVHYAAEDLPDSFKALAKDGGKEKVYLLYCPYGTRSAFLAEMMQDEGFEAYAFRGGLEAVKKAVKA